ncbi:MAG: (4Fe-4S)-binding protein [Candidatus Omnitrophota bacterium]|jgi:MinD superfamily P-loop ATPase|nr:MAG: (4Fe-4S)-binding protein [Candidatus Omnitrophota bacterium]
MKIAVASGKGGTGKTTVSTNLAFIANQIGKQVHLLDCDVEEPNCHIFLQPTITSTESICVPVPEVDVDRCTGCGECAAICRFNAIACLKKGVLIFNELCHGCGGCWRVCPEKAITVGSREIGVLENGASYGFRFTQGILRIGEAKAPPLIRKVKEAQNGSALVIFDSPPGTSCPAIETMKGVDAVLLVTEPTPFGLSDLTLAVETVRKMEILFAVVINRCDAGENKTREYCQRERIPILLEIPDRRSVAEAYSRGEMAAHCIPEIRNLFEQLLHSLEEMETQSQ